MCGTPDYLAPEIILNKGHNHAVDYWALGVLIFEMIHGWPPFYHDQPMKVYEKIITGKVDYPATFTKALEDIVSKFLVKNPSKRLGNVKGGIADITKHKWFGSFDWRGLMAGTLLAPSMPNLSAFDAAVAAEGEDESDEDDDDESERHEVCHACSSHPCPSGCADELLVQLEVTFGVFSVILVLLNSKM